MFEKSNKPETIAGIAIYAAMFTGFASVIVAFGSLVTLNWLGAGVGFGAAALAFGLVANAILRHRNYDLKTQENYDFKVSKTKADSNWSFTHSIECPVSREFAWGFWTDVDNWAVVDPAAEWVRLDGPFAAGAMGVTKPRNSDIVEWKIVEVRDRNSAVIEIPAPGAVVRFNWRFEEINARMTRITQEVTLEGDRAADYEAAVRGLEEGIPQGMQKLAEGMKRSVSLHK